MKLIQFLLIIAINFTFGQTQTKNNAVNQVFNDIVTAWGSNLEEPDIEINEDADKQRQMGIYLPSSNKIIIDQKAIDICNSFGDDSLNNLAFILAHELTHRYKKHIWITNEDRNSFKSFSFMNNIKNFSQNQTRRLEIESEADLKGGFYAYIAGYDALNSAPLLLDSLYKKYNQKNENLIYPSLEERKDMCKEQIKKLERLKVIFDASNYALVSGYYKGAQKGFSKILNEEFLSKEIWNNLGLSYILEAIEKMDDTTIFAYPFELDSKSRLNNINPKFRAIGGINKSEIESLINEAIKRFKKANYKISQLNISCCYSLLTKLYNEDSKKRDEYFYEAENAYNKYKTTLAKEYFKNNMEMQEKFKDNPVKFLVKTNDTSDLATIYVMNGILNYQKSTDLKNKSIKLFKMAQKLGINNASINLSIINSNFRKDPTQKTQPYLEKIEDYDFNQILLTKNFQEPYESYDLDNTHNYKLNVKRFENSTAYLFTYNRRDPFFIHVTRNQASKSGIMIDDNIEKLENKYSEKPIKINGNKENFLHFPKNKTIFLENKNKITGWLFYKKIDSQ